MLKIWNGAFWNETPAVKVLTEDRAGWNMAWVITVLTLISLGIGVGAEAVP